MIGRDEVLHVAKLARLRLEEAEVERMTGEMSAVLEHIDLIGQLDLEGVEPTSHVVPIVNVWREDEPRESLERDIALSQAPEHAQDSFSVPSPQA